MNIQLESIFVDLEFADGGYSLVIYNTNPDVDDNTQRHISEMITTLEFDSEKAMLDAVRIALAGKVYNEFACKYFSFSTVYKDLTGIAKATEITM